MKNDLKYRHKTSYRINDHIRRIIEQTSRDVCIKTHLKLSNGKIARSFWEALAVNPKLHKKCLDCVCEKILKERTASNSNDEKKYKNKR